MGVQPRLEEPGIVKGKQRRTLKECGRPFASSPALLQSARRDMGGLPGFAWLRPSNPWAGFLEAFSLPASESAKQSCPLAPREERDAWPLSDEQAPKHFPCLAHTRLCRRGAKRQRTPRFPFAFLSALSAPPLLCGKTLDGCGLRAVDV